MIMIYKQKKIKIKPRIKLNHNIYIDLPRAKSEAPVNKFIT